MKKKAPLTAPSPPEKPISFQDIKIGEHFIFKDKRYKKTSSFAAYNKNTGIVTFKQNN